MMVNNKMLLWVLESLGMYVYAEDRKETQNFSVNLGAAEIKKEIENFNVAENNKDYFKYYFQLC